MRTAQIAIVGGGLSGLYAAYLLERQGLTNYMLLEARDTFGGRIESTCFEREGARVDDARKAPDCFDLGPTWYWPAYQIQLDHVVRHFGIASFVQHETGDMLVERSPCEAPARMPGYTSSPLSVRLRGGMAALVSTLRREISAANLVTSQEVLRLRCDARRVELIVADAQRRVISYRAQYVMLAVPPRLAVASIDFSPNLPGTLAAGWQRTATWMAPHAKYLAIYDSPFWRDRGLSGEARSACGPLGEIHDASVPDGSAALFGFFAVPARSRQDVSDDVMRSHCRAQLIRLFGPQAAAPKVEIIKDWAQDPYTAAPADLDADPLHGAAPEPNADSGVWQGRITGIASEWSPNFPGYVAGAIEAASLGVQYVLAQLRQASFSRRVQS